MPALAGGGAWPPQPMSVVTGTVGKGGPYRFAHAPEDDPDDELPVAQFLARASDEALLRAVAQSVLEISVTSVTCARRHGHPPTACPGAGVAGCSATIWRLARWRVHAAWRGRLDRSPNGTRTSRWRGTSVYASNEASSPDRATPTESDSVGSRGTTQRPLRRCFPKDMDPVSPRPLRPCSTACYARPRKGERPPKHRTPANAHRTYPVDTALPRTRHGRPQATTYRRSAYQTVGQTASEPRKLNPYKKLLKVTGGDEGIRTLETVSRLLP